MRGLVHWVDLEELERGEREAELAGFKGPRWKEELRRVWEDDGKGDKVTLWKGGGRLTFKVTQSPGHRAHLGEQWPRRALGLP